VLFQRDRPHRQPPYYLTQVAPYRGKEYPPDPKDA
jgi:hypothetical protein